MEKFDIKKAAKQLKKTAELAEINADATIFLIQNNMMLYNDLIDAYLLGDTAKVYLMYQLSGSIFKQLAAFQQVPTKQKEVKKTEDSVILEVINKVNKR